MSGYTPGPWSVAECSHGGGLLRRGDQSGRSCHVQSSLQILPIEDARLIAAAPDLFGALKGMVTAFAHRHEDWPELLEARAAIAKAEGR